MVVAHKDANFFVGEFSSVDSIKELKRKKSLGWKWYLGRSQWSDRWWIWTLSVFFWLCMWIEWTPKQKQENLRRGWKMAWVRVSGPPRVEVAIDMGHPFLNLTVDAFLRIGTVIFSPFSLSFLNSLINYFTIYLFCTPDRSHARRCWRYLSYYPKE